MATMTVEKQSSIQKDYSDTIADVVEQTIESITEEYYNVQGMCISSDEMFKHLYPILNDAVGDVDETIYTEIQMEACKSALLMLMGAGAHIVATRNGEHTELRPGQWPDTYYI